MLWEWERVSVEHSGGWAAGREGQRTLVKRQKTRVKRQETMVKRHNTIEDHGEKIQYLLNYKERKNKKKKKKKN